MTDRDYLWCVLNLMLDDEEELKTLCPDCRGRAEEFRCSCCGAPLPEENAGFDEARFAQLKEGGR
ncbi:MAG: molybdopterin oxidoreductase [Oscillospiraceae bacterium]